MRVGAALFTLYPVSGGGLGPQARAGRTISVACRKTAPRCRIFALPCAFSGPQTPGGACWATLHVRPSDDRASMSELDINLFAGAGGLARGLRWAGFDATLLYENDTRAWQTLKVNKLISRDPPGWEDHNGDVKLVRWQDIKRPVRLIAAGVPCQPFSLAGKHLADRDGRNLFPELLRAIRYLRPKSVLVENVQGFLRDGFKPYFEYILRRLEMPSMKARNDELWRSHDRRLRRHQCQRLGRIAR